MDLQTIKEYDKKYFMNTYGNRTDVVFTHGEGMFLYSTEGKKYMDLLAGIAVSALGHNHPKLTGAIIEQAKKYIHSSSLYYIDKQALLAKKIVENSCADKVFFSNSGAEANEGAIKLARVYHQKKGNIRKFEIITLEKSFHGRTLATIAATGQEKYHKHYDPLTPTFKSIPMNDVEAFKKMIDENTCALMIEPIQGESGVNPVSKEYVKQIRKICDENDIILMFDEVQCGMGRTGKLFAYEHLEVEPDIFTLAKALGGGFPIGALCAKEKFSAFEPGDHGSTFGGNPLACAAGLAVFDAFLEENLVSRGNAVGEYLIRKLTKLKNSSAVISEVRGMGLMIGIEFNQDIAKKIKSMLFDAGFLVGSVHENIIRLLPPLIISEQDADQFIKAFALILEGIGS
ncbi:MAG: aspartate aminotransferase family protein [Clostridia bacterium]|nr:aspartate aminotransferase family protein [Clostridia bacterium]